MAPRRRIEGPVMDEVVLLALKHRHWSPTQIHREVNGDVPIGEPELVSLRTVQRVVTDVRARDESGDWTLEDGEPEDIPLVLPVVRILAEQRSGRPSKNEARWIARIRRAYPNLDDLELVAAFAVYASRGEPLLSTVEQILMYTPWEDDAKALGDAYARRLIGFNVLFTFGYEAAATEGELRLRRKGANR